MNFVTFGGGGGFGGSDGAGQSTAAIAGDTKQHSYNDADGSIYVYMSQLSVMRSVLSDYPGYGAGNDTINGGAGSDELFGLGGADEFEFDLAAAGADETDRIWDLTEADCIVLRDGEPLSLKALQAVVRSARAVDADADNQADDLRLTLSNGEHSMHIDLINTSSLHVDAATATLVKGPGTALALGQLSVTATHWKNGKGALNGVDVGIQQAGQRIRTDDDGRINAQNIADPDSVDDGHTVLRPQLNVTREQADITLTDVLAALKVYLNKPLDATYDTPYKYIAADFQGDGDVDLSDVLSLLKYYLKKPVDAAPSWVFVDSAQTVQVDDELLPESSTAGLALSKGHAAPADIHANLDSDTPLQLIGVLRGDLDGSGT